VLWHYEGMKEDALQKGLPAPDEAVVPNAMFVACYEPHGRRTIRSLFLSVTGSSFTVFFSSITGLELGSLHFSPARFATEISTLLCNVNPLVVGASLLLVDTGGLAPELLLTQSAFFWYQQSIWCQQASGTVVGCSVR